MTKRIERLKMALRDIDSADFADDALAKRYYEAKSEVFLCLKLLEQQAAKEDFIRCYKIAIEANG